MASLARSRSRQRAARRLVRLLVALALLGMALGAAAWPSVADSRPTATGQPAAVTASAGPTTPQRVTPPAGTPWADEPGTSPAGTARAEGFAAPSAEEPGTPGLDRSAVRGPALAGRPSTVGQVVMAASAARVGPRAVPAPAGPRAPPTRDA